MWLLPLLKCYNNRPFRNSTFVNFSYSYFNTKNRFMSVMARTYEEAVDHLNSLQTNASILEALRKAGPSMNEKSLPEMREYVRRIGYEPLEFDNLNVIHIAGTKGKGSTSAFCESILRHYNFSTIETSQKNLRTGFFSSPHLIAVRERIRINGKPLSEADFAKYFFEVWDRLEATKEQVHKSSGDRSPKSIIMDARQHNDKPTYFRFLTLMAFHVFMRERVDAAVFEVGVGGEYDSTNIIEQPIVTGISALGLDHVRVLGDTIDKIAWHKAGIIKHKRPAVTVEQPPEAMEIINQRALEKEAPLQIVTSKDAGKLADIPLGLAGIHQRYNAALSVELCKAFLQIRHDIKFDPKEYPPVAFIEGLRNVRWPGRGQELAKYGVTWYLDGAHTVESLQACADWFSSISKSSSTPSPKRILVFNCTNGRDGNNLLPILARLQSIEGVFFDHAVFCTGLTWKSGYANDNTNHMHPEEQTSTALQELLAESWLSLSPATQTHIKPSVQAAVEWIREYQLQTAKEGSEIQTLVTGSLILVGNVMVVLGQEVV